MRTLGACVLQAMVFVAGCGPGRAGSADGARSESSAPPSSDAAPGVDSEAPIARLPLLDCFGRDAVGCARGVLESPIGRYWDSPYGSGPRFLSPQGMVTVRPASAMGLGAGTLYFWARHFDALEPGQTHVLVQLAVIDDTGQVDTSNRAHVLFRDGDLEGLVAADALQVGPLGERADWQHDVIAPGQWHQYALSWDEREVCLFVDGGMLAHQARSAGGMSASVARVYVGARFDGSYAADSQIAHLVLWDARLSHPDIQRLFLAELGALKLPVAVQAAGQDGVPRDRLELPFAGPIPALDFHVTPALPIGPGARVLIGLGHSNGEFFGSPGSVTVDLPAGVTGAAECTSSARLPIAKMCSVTIDGTVPAGSELVLHLAELPLAAKATISRRDASNVWPQVFVDCGGDASCTGALLPVTSNPSLAFTAPAADPRVEVFARMPSTVTVGQPVSLRLWAEKADGAPDLDAAFTVSFGAIAGLSGLPSSYAFSAGPDGSAEITGLRFAAVPPQNPVALTATTDAGEGLNLNPVEVLAPASSPQLFWGDLHLHSTFSDGKEVASGLYPFARSRGLDFAAISDHVNTGDVYATPWEFNHTMNAADWQALQGLARSYDVPGSFVTLLAYEASIGSIWELSNCLGQGASRCPMVEGDWNVYFSSDSAPLPNADSVFAADGILATLATLDPLAVVIPHYGGRRADLLGLVGHPNQSLVPVLEIISNHTTPPDGAEGWASQIVASGGRLGFIGSSDDHSGHPGRSMWQTRYGYLAAWASSLDRAAILDAIRRRHTYAASHDDRPIVTVSANGGATMGDVVRLAAGEDPAMSVTVSSRAQVATASLVRDGSVAWQETPTSSTTAPPFAVTVSYSEPLPRNGTGYYWKIAFDNGSAVWTSPIWFDR